LFSDGDECLDFRHSFVIQGGRNSPRKLRKAIGRRDAYR